VSDELFLEAGHQESPLVHRAVRECLLLLLLLLLLMLMMMMRMLGVSTLLAFVAPLLGVSLSICCHSSIRTHPQSTNPSTVTPPPPIHPSISTHPPIHPQILDYYSKQLPPPEPELADDTKLRVGAGCREGLGLWVGVGLGVE